MSLRGSSRSSHTTINDSPSSRGTGAGAGAAAVNAARSIADDLLSDDTAYIRRPPSPGLPLHRDTAMSNLELHGSGAGAQQRRRGGAGAGGAGASSAPSSRPGSGSGTDGSTRGMRAYEGHDGDDNDDDDMNEKDYLMDRPALPVSSSEKDKWSKLIPEDVGGARRRAGGGPGSRKQGLAGLVGAAPSHLCLLLLIPCSHSSSSHLPPPPWPTGPDLTIPATCLSACPHRDPNLRRTSGPTTATGLPSSSTLPSPSTRGCTASGAATRSCGTRPISASSGHTT